jgi:hypothetical protein
VRATDHPSDRRTATLQRALAARRRSIIVSLGSTVAGRSVNLVIAVLKVRRPVSTCRSPRMRASRLAHLARTGTQRASRAGYALAGSWARCSHRVRILPAVIVDWLNERRARRLQERSKVECGFRVITGEHVGLPQMGSRRRTPDAGPHHLPAKHRTRAAGTEPLTAPALIAVKSLAPGHRGAQGREAWVVNITAPIVTLNTGQAVLEWALPDAEHEWAVARAS